MQKFKERLKSLRTKEGYTQKEMAALLGLSSNSYLSQLERGDREPSDMLVRLLDVLEKESGRDTGSMLVREVDYKPSLISSKDFDEGVSRVVWLPVIPWDSEAAADIIREKVMQAAISRIPVAQTDVPDDDAYGLKIKGDAMAPNFAEGALAVVSPNSSLQSGCLVVGKLINDRGRLFRQYQPIGGGRFRLMAYNERYQDTEHSEEDFEWMVPVIFVITSTL